MNLGEFETVTTYDLPIKIMVLNNFGDGMVMQWQRALLQGPALGERQVTKEKEFCEDR